MQFVLCQCTEFSLAGLEVHQVQQIYGMELCLVCEELLKIHRLLDAQVYRCSSEVSVGKKTYTFSQPVGCRSAFGPYEGVFVMHYSSSKSEDQLEQLCIDMQSSLQKHSNR